MSRAPGAGAGCQIVPPAVPFSVWVLLKDVADGAEHGADGTEPGGVRTEWYINLEATHRARMKDALYTSDHILDITFPVESANHCTAAAASNPNGAVFKDVDELAAAANYGASPDVIGRTSSAQRQSSARPPRRFLPGHSTPKWESEGPRSGRRNDASDRR